LLTEEMAASSFPPEDRTVQELIGNLTKP